MATIAKRRARKLTDAGKPQVGYANVTMPMLAQKKHVTIDIGDHTIRIEWADAQQVADEINKLMEFYRHC